jgi:hypothetical protein
VQTCLFCGGDASEPDHGLHCDGRQGAVEAAYVDPADRDRWQAATPPPITSVPYVAYREVRTTDPDTSAAAAASIAAEATEVQRRVYAIHAAHPDGLTDEELLTVYLAIHGPAAESSPRKRRCDLAHAGLIVDSGDRRPLISGRNGIVWTIARVKVGAP